MSGKSMNKAIENLEKKDEKIKNFSDILESIDSLEDKKKLLWKEIYENAIEDRESANILFTDLVIQSRGNTANHQVFGTTMAKYLERMSKSNDQIIKLAELISKEREKESLTSDDIFNTIAG